MNELTEAEKQTIITDLEYITRENMLSVQEKTKRNEIIKKLRSLPQFLLSSRRHRPTIFEQWGFGGTNPNEMRNELENIANETRKYTREELREIITIYKEKTKKLK